MWADAFTRCAPCLPRTRHLLGFAPSSRNLPLPRSAAFIRRVNVQVKHLYHYEDLEHRERVRRAISQDVAWQAYLPHSQTMVAHTEAMLFVEATDCHQAAGIPSAVDFSTPARVADPDAPQPVYELRTYQCHLGYDTVPKVRVLRAECRVTAGSFRGAAQQGLCPGGHLEVGGVPLQLLTP